MPFLTLLPLDISLLLASSIAHAHAQAQTHAKLFMEQMRLVIKADECEGPEAPERFCKALRKRVARASCGPVMIETIPNADSAIIVHGVVTVDPDGRVSAVDLIQPSSNPELDEAIRDSVRQCRLPKLKQGGQPIGSRFYVTWQLRDSGTKVLASDNPRP